MGHGTVKDVSGIGPSIGTGGHLVRGQVLRSAHDGFHDFSTPSYPPDPSGFRIIHGPYLCLLLFVFVTRHGYQLLSWWWWLGGGGGSNYWWSNRNGWTCGGSGHHWFFRALSRGFLVIYLDWMIHER